MAAEPDGKLMADPERLQEIFEQTLALPTERRDAALERECAGDPTLLAELRGLLQGHVAAEANSAWKLSALEQEARNLARRDGVGETIGAYRLVELLGTGGMGSVYRGVRNDAEYQTSVAIKRIRRGMDAEQIIARFRVERQILASLNHPNIARLLDGGTDSDGLPYLVMEYISGEPLTGYCDARKLTVGERLGLFRKICDAVHYAHQRMVIHRDLKPGNILVTEGDTPKLLDFGIAKLTALEPGETAAAATQTGMQMMTVGYASPEQVKGEVVTTASDVYSLGVILYELLTSQSPYGNTGRPVHELMTAVCEQEPARPSTLPQLAWKKRLRGDLDNIVMKALQKNPRDRYASADQLAEDIGRHLAGLPVIAHGDSFSYVAAKFVRRHKLLVGAAAMVVVSLTGGIVATLRAQARAERRFNDVRKLAHSVVFEYPDAIEPLPGSTPVRKKLVQDGLAYLDSLAGEAEDFALRRELVQAYVRISNVQGNSYYSNLGDSAGALVTAHKAVELAQALLGQDSSPESFHAAAQADAAEGELHYAQGDLLDAEAFLQRSVELRRRLRRQRPAEVQNLVELVSGLRHLGDLLGAPGLSNLGRLQPALEIYREAAEVAAAALRYAPRQHTVRRERSQVAMQIATVEMALGHFAEADRGFRDALAALERISAENPDNAGDRMEVAGVSLRVGGQLVEQRQAALALPYLEKAAALVEASRLADPKNTLYQRNLSVTENQWANALRLAGRPSEALPHSRRSLRIVEELSAAHPGTQEFVADIAISHRKLAETLLALQDARGALEHSVKAVEQLTPMAKGDPALGSHHQRALVVEGAALLALHRSEDALERYRLAEEEAVRLVASDRANLTLRSELARSQAARGDCLMQMGRTPEAVAVFERAVDNWNRLRDAHALSGEDAYRAAEAERLHSRLQSAQNK